MRRCVLESRARPRNGFCCVRKKRRTSISYRGKQMSHDGTESPEGRDSLRRSFGARNVMVVSCNAPRHGVKVIDQGFPQESCDKAEIVPERDIFRIIAYNRSILRPGQTNNLFTPTGECVSCRILAAKMARLVGSDRMSADLNFVEKVKSELGFKAAHREVIEGGWHMCAPGAK